MPQRFLETVYELAASSPLKPIELQVIAERLGLAYEEAIRLASWLHHEQLVYRFEGRGEDDPIQLIITRSGIDRVLQSREDGG